MRNPALLYPMFALGPWTLSCSCLPVARARSARRGEIAIDDFKYGESPAVSAAVSIPNRSYMNLLDLPMLFYVALPWVIAAVHLAAAAP